MLCQGACAAGGPRKESGLEKKRKELLLHDLSQEATSGATKLLKDHAKGFTGVLMAAAKDPEAFLNKLRTRANRTAKTRIAQTDLLLGTVENLGILQTVDITEMPRGGGTHALPPLRFRADGTLNRSRARRSVPR